MSIPAPRSKSSTISDMVFSWVFLVLAAGAPLWFYIFTVFFFDPNSDGAERLRQDATLLRSERVALEKSFDQRDREALARLLDPAEHDYAVSYMLSPGESSSVRVDTGIQALVAGTAAPGILGEVLPSAPSGVRATINTRFETGTPALKCVVTDDGCDGLSGTGSMKYQGSSIGEDEIVLSVRIEIDEDDSLIGQKLAGTLTGTGTTTVGGAGSYSTQSFEVSKELTVDVVPSKARDCAKLQWSIDDLEERATQAEQAAERRKADDKGTSVLGGMMSWLFGISLSVLVLFIWGWCTFRATIHAVKDTMVVFDPEQAQCWIDWGESWAPDAGAQEFERKFGKRTT